MASHGLVPKRRSRYQPSPPKITTLSTISKEPEDCLSCSLNGLEFDDSEGRGGRLATSV